MAAPQPKLTPASLAKNAGNDAYKAGDYALAVTHYTTALHASSPYNVDAARSSALVPRSRNEPQEIYLINRALAYIKLQQFVPSCSRFVRQRRVLTESWRDQVRRGDRRLYGCVGAQCPLVQGVL